MQIANKLAFTLHALKECSKTLFKHYRPYGFTSDSWAMGCLMYEMATNSVPFEAKSMNELKYKVLRGT